MPLCPYCDNQVNFENIKRTKESGFFSGYDEVIYSCPQCEKILSVSFID
jgi:hypothetical protein